MSESEREEDEVTLSVSGEEDAPDGSEHEDGLEELDALEGGEDSSTKKEKKAKKKRKRGVIYLSSVPRFMKPAKVKHLMSQYGAVDRVFLQPEDPKVRQRRMKNGGSKKINYVEGWVEFLDKRIAKRVAAMLNGNIVGGKRNNYHYDTIWNMKYLSKFQWHHLTEQMAYEKASKEHRLQAEMEQVNKETNMFIQQLQKTKKIQHAQEKRESEGGKRQHDEAHFTAHRQRKPIKRKKEKEQ